MPRRATSLAARDLLPAARFRSRQRLHFLLCVILPLIACIALPLTAPELSWFSPVNFALLAAMWYLTGCVGVSVGFHRHFTHRSFRATRLVRLLFAITGMMAAQGPVSYWVAVHRRHHAFADALGDIHSPHRHASAARSALASFLHGHFGWAIHHDVPSPAKYASDIRSDPATADIDGYYWPAVIAGIALPTVIGLAIYQHPGGALLGLYWGGVLRIVIGHNVIWSINSVCHTFGSRPNRTRDKSTNCAWLAVLSWGESWHNNHHSVPSSARFGWGRMEPDLGWSTILALERIGLVYGIRIHPPSSKMPRSVCE